MVWYDDTVLRKWLAGGSPGNTGLSITPGPGQEGPAGQLQLQGGSYCARLLVKSTPPGPFGGLTGLENCWNFLNCYLMDAADFKIGVVKTVWRMKWRAVPGQQSSGSNGVVLWNTTCV